MALMETHYDLCRTERNASGHGPRSTAVALCIAAGALLASLAPLGAAGDKSGQTKGPILPNGIYGVLRSSGDEKAIRPVKEDEAAMVNGHRFLKKSDKEPPVYLVVHKQPDVPLVLAAEPEAVKDEKGLQIRLKLHADHAKTMERFTRENKGGQAAVILGGEVVTVHKIRDVVTGGAIQITNCNEDAGAFLLKQLQDLSQKK